MSYAGLIPIRDTIIKIGWMTLFGRIGYHIDNKQKIRSVTNTGTVLKTDYTSSQEQMIADINAQLHIECTIPGQINAPFYFTGK